MYVCWNKNFKIYWHLRKQEHRPHRPLYHLQINYNVYKINGDSDTRSILWCLKNETNNQIDTG